ncbi:hypothetical protein BX666DRAFT_1956104 [Dichotomocladium elegans]|nr:hypothetical protein BX666DRAFT_1956104 [Dichotomocladium elegans]
MSDSSEASDFSEDETKQQSHETATPVAPRIKLKLRLNPSASSSVPAHSTANDDDDDDEGHRKRKKHKSKKKKSHKKRKKQRIHDTDDDDSNIYKRHQLPLERAARRESDSQLSVDDEEYNNGNNTEDYDQESIEHASVNHHVPVGSKRPFAMLQALDEKDEENEENENVYEDDYEDDAGFVDSYQDQHRRRDSMAGHRTGYTGRGAAAAAAATAAGIYDKNPRNEGLLNNLTTINSEPMDHVVHPTDSASATATATSSTAGVTGGSNRGRKPKTIQTIPGKGDQKPKKRGRPAKSKSQPKPEPRVNEAPRKDMKTVCTKLLDTFEKRDAYGFFLQPVDTSIVKDYLTVIKQPMDFLTMRRKLQSDLYPDMDAFKADFLLIVTNAKTYNAPDTIYYKSADRLQQYGVKAIERAEKSIVYGSPQPEEIPPSMEAHPLPSRRQSSMSISRKDSNVKVEEEVDILGLDNPSNYTISARKASRQDMDMNSDLNSPRAITPTRGSSKKKKKKVADAGIIYAPDGSLAALGGDLSALIPPERRFADLPEVTTANIHALPSAFFTSRSTYEEWSNNKHIINPASFCDYGAFTALGEEAPGAFYTAQDACYIYPLYGDDRGEAYMRSLWEFVDDLNLKKRIDDKSKFLTRGAWDVLKQALKGPENCQDVDTEFGTVHKADFKQAYDSVMEDKPVTSS